MRRIIVVVNKWYEANPVLATLLHPMACPSGFPWPVLSQLRPSPVPTLPAPPALPRAIFPFKTMQVEFWCVSDLLAQVDQNHQSSSESKVNVLSQITAYGVAPDLVISISTASSVSATESTNGCVIVGTKAFLHDGHPAVDPNPYSAWRDRRFGSILESSFTKEDFTKVFDQIPPSVNASLTPTRNFPANPLQALALYEYTALSTVNVTDSSDYKKADPDTVSAFGGLNNSSAVAGSVETTHAVVRAVIDAPFLFISPIVNRLTMFGADCAPNQYPHELAGCSNAGVVLAWTLGQLDKLT